MDYNTFSTLLKYFTASKVSKYGVYSGPYLDTFHAVQLREKSKQMNPYPQLLNYLNN